MAVQVDSVLLATVTQQKDGTYLVGCGDGKQTDQPVVLGTFKSVDDANALKASHDAECQKRADAGEPWFLKTMVTAVAEAAAAAEAGDVQAG